MTWRVFIPADAQQEIWELPGATRTASMQLVDRLRAAPDAATGPYGIDAKGPARMRQAASGGVIAVVLISDTTGNVTVTRIVRTRPAPRPVERGTAAPHSYAASSSFGDRFLFTTFLTESGFHPSPAVSTSLGTPHRCARRTTASRRATHRL